MPRLALAALAAALALSACGDRPKSLNPFSRLGPNEAHCRAALDNLVARETAQGPVLRSSVDASLAKIPAGPILLFTWRPGVDDAWRARARDVARTLAEATCRIVEADVCGHGVGPPVCWCRPPLPGLWVAFARRHRLTTRGSVVVATAPAHRTFATALGLDVIEAKRSPD